MDSPRQTQRVEAAEEHPSAADWAVAAGALLRDVMLCLDRSGVQIAMVLDDCGRLVGTMTDGDVRRALLRGVGMDASIEPHMQKRFTSVGPKTDRAEVLDLMRARGIQEIPIVDGEGRVVGLHLMREILGGAERPNWAVIMAGGEGSRLRPLTESLPKPMIPVAGRPILERLVLHLVGFGIRRIFLAIRYLGHTIEGHFGDGSGFGCRIEYLREGEPAGSGGPLSLLPEAPGVPLLVMNGDLVTQADVGSMLEFHARNGCKATVGVREYRHQMPFGSVEAQGHRVTRLEEKPLLRRLMNCGIYVLTPDLLKRVPKGTHYALPSLIEDCLTRGEAVGAFPVEDEWIDVGQLDQLRLAREGSPEE